MQFFASSPENISTFSISVSHLVYSGLIIITYSFQTYTELVNKGKYDSVKYSKVEDLGAQDEPASDRVKTSTTRKKLGKWSSVR